MTWRDDAACKGMNLAIFFNAPEGSRYAPGSMAVVLAKSVCARCLVCEPCADEAIAEREKHGIRGGLTPSERRNAVVRGSRSDKALYASRVCDECGKTFEYLRKPGQPALLCSELCRLDRRLKNYARYEETHRKGGNDTRTRAHGTLETYRSGCRCASCARVEATRRRRYRLQAAS